MTSASGYFDVSRLLPRLRPLFAVKSWVYCRCSHEDQDLKSQKHELAKWLKGQDEVVEWYEDEGRSGMTLDRPAWKRLIADLQPGDKLVCYALDRVCRDLHALHHRRPPASGPPDAAAGAAEFVRGRGSSWRPDSVANPAFQSSSRQADGRLIPSNWSRMVCNTPHTKSYPAAQSLDVERPQPRCRRMTTPPPVRGTAMPRTLPLAAAAPKLAEIVAGMTPGEELVLTTDGEPVAVVTRPPRTSWPSVPGTAKDRTLWMAADFDAPLEDFAEYME